MTGRFRERKSQICYVYFGRKKGTRVLFIFQRVKSGRGRAGSGGAFFSGAVFYVIRRERSWKELEKKKKKTVSLTVF